MKRVLVTGAGGFIGANLLRRLRADGHEVHGFVRPGSSLWRLQDAKNDLSLHEVDVRDKQCVRRAAASIGADWVFHLAAYGNSSWESSLEEMVRTNILGTVYLLEACMEVGFECFLHAGSSSEYGFKDHAPTEEERLEPNSHYALTKAFASSLCEYTGRMSLPRVVSLRFYSVFGPYEEPKRFIPTLIVRGLEGCLPPLVAPDIARDYIYVDDVVEACILAANHPDIGGGEIYNLGSGVQVSTAAAVDVARKLLRVETAPCWGSMANRIWDTSTWLADATKFSAASGWSPKYSFEAGFQQMISWLRTNPALLRHYAEKVHDSSTTASAKAR